MEHLNTQDATQQCTQGAMDPRRFGRNNSGLSSADIADVMCILHPCSPAAYNIVAYTAEHASRNVLQNDEFQDFVDDLTPSVLEEQETFILGADGVGQATDLALRFSTKVIDPTLGFVFGRNPRVCDIVVANDTSKRVSNMHFAIFINSSGVLMLQDMSTNGTVVDGVLLKAKEAHTPQTRMLNSGSIVQILTPKADEFVKFVVRIPAREGHVEQYEANFREHLRRLDSLRAARMQQKHAADKRPAMLDHTRQTAVSYVPPLVQNQYGMHWSGGEKYNVVGLIGKGAFATVYRVATKAEGQVFAAKELEKRKFMKNGVLDHKLGNEMDIMQSISHPNIVRFVDYHDHANHIYIIMEFVPSGDLQKFLGLHGPLPEFAARRMAVQVLDALAYLHDKKITHRDIKPDNILLASAELDSFSVKLSDFGLSKVVPDNDTFLKTFCGTLLYCAPEVFPHYDAHVAGRGLKRTRRSSAQPPTKFHSYSQSVDMWSFGAVLWYSLCCKPPFEGVSDKDGRGMFERIMMTPLDTDDLRHANVSSHAIAVLVGMLDTNPSNRPSPRSCLQYEWFRQDKSIEGSALARLNGKQHQIPPTERGMFAISEEKEGANSGEPDLSQLSLDERSSGDGSQDSHYDEASIHSGSLNFFDPRQSKRFKSDHFTYRDPDEAIDSSPELFHQSIPIVLEPNLVAQQIPPAQPPKLFGEISLSALASPSALGARANAAVGNSVSTSPSDAGSRGSHNSALQAQQPAQRGLGATADPSLLGAESLMRDVDLDSLQAGNEPSAEEADGPRTPNLDGSGDERGAAALKEFLEDETPKPKQPPKFRRQFELRKPMSFWFDADDPSTHNAEYATKVSGHDYVSELKRALLEPSPLPDTRSGSTTDRDLNEHVGGDTDAEPDHHPAPQEIAAPVSSPTADFAKPPLPLGRFTSTPDSFAQLTFPINRRDTSWGRDPTNTYRWPDKADVRIPKFAFFLVFHHPDIDVYPDPKDWVQLTGLHCVIWTNSTRGIWINGVHLLAGQPHKRHFGRVYSGDEITVVPPSSSASGEVKHAGLKFVLELFYGEARERRPLSAMPRFVVEVEGAPGAGPQQQQEQQQQQRRKNKGKEKVVEEQLVGKEVVAI